MTVDGGGGGGFAGACRGRLHPEHGDDADDRGGGDDERGDLVTVAANGNVVDSPNKSVTVSGTAVGGNGVAAPPNVTLTLEDDDATATATLVLTPSSILENGEVSTVTATLSHPTTEATTLTVAAAAGANAVAADFTLSTAAKLTIAAGATTSAGLVTVTANDDALASGMKSVTVSATAAGGRGVAAPSDATLTIRDDEYGLDGGRGDGPGDGGGGDGDLHGGVAHAAFGGGDGVGREPGRGTRGWCRRAPGRRRPRRP